ncbi:hypothetical protein BGZ93_001201 [Podila epicladia]|nr:hypothetical protein BGZ93_001201 [Podila epicladia]
MPLAPSRLARQESEKRTSGPRAGLSRNRNSDYYPSPPPLVVGPPPMPRSNSVPVPTLQSLGINPTAGSPPLDMPITETTGAIHDESEDATLRLPPVIPKQRGPAATKHQRHGSVDLNIQKASKVVPKVVSLEITVPEETLEEQEKNYKANGDEDEEPITVIHSPISEEHWHAQLQKAGQKLMAKKPIVKEDEAQLSKDVQDKFNISTEKLNRMVKEWDRSKSGGDNGFGTKSMRKKKGRENSAMLDELAALSLSEFEAEEAGTGTKVDNGSLEDSAPRWRHKASLKRHLDTVSSLTFHPVNKSILTGSEDGTMRYWNLEPLLRESRKNVSAEIEPVHIYRGHTKSITSVAISVDQNKCFSSSLDSTVRSWKLVSMDKETYSRADRTIPLGSFVGHTDVVWDIRLFPLSISSSQLLASISADGSLKIWDTETRGSPLKSSWGYHGLLGPRDPSSSTGVVVAPTSVDFCPTDLKKVVVSYANSVVKLFDIETGQAILDFKSNETYDGTPSTQINKIVCHPTMPVVVSAHEDRYIRFFDLNSGNCSFSMISHLDAVSSLDIDPAGLVLCSGGHDGSVRLWDLASVNRACLQEFPGHRRRGDEGVCAVQYHKSMPKLLATGGADSVAKLWAWN